MSAWQKRSETSQRKRASVFWESRDYSGVIVFIKNQFHHTDFYHSTRNLHHNIFLWPGMGSSFTLYYLFSCLWVSWCIIFYKPDWQNSHTICFKGKKVFFGSDLNVLNLFCVWKLLKVPRLQNHYLFMIVHQVLCLTCICSKFMFNTPYSIYHDT